jgi:hypothetical protein
MRFLAGLLPVVLLLALVPPAPVPADSEIVVDDEATTVQTTGVWATTAVSSGFVGHGYHFRVAGAGTNTLTWPFIGPFGANEADAIRWLPTASAAPPPPTSTTTSIHPTTTTSRTGNRGLAL